MPVDLILEIEVDTARRHEKLRVYEVRDYADYVKTIKHGFAFLRENITFGTRYGYPVIIPSIIDEQIRDILRLAEHC